MSTDDRIRNNRRFRLPLLIMGIVMVILFFGLGFALLLSKEFVPGFDSQFRNIFAVMLLVYGGWRSWRIYTYYFQEKENF